MTTPTPTVPDALWRKWRDEAEDCIGFSTKTLANRAAAWAWAQRDEEVRQARQEGADAELEACVAYLEQQTFCGHRLLIPSLRAARRPPAPTLRERALAELRLRRITTTDDGSVIISNDLLELTLAALQKDVK